MAFISSTQINTATGKVLEQFDFFAREVKIHKAPIENIVTSPSNYLYGYGEEQTTNSEITYTVQNAIYSGLIIYPFKNKGDSNGYIDNKIIIDPNKTYIKVKSQAKDYILNGNKTEKIEFDGQTWNLESEKYQVQTYLTLNFYYFAVKGTN